MAITDFSFIPAVITIINTDPGVVNKDTTTATSAGIVTMGYITEPMAQSVQLYRTNFWITIDNLDSVKIVAQTSEEVAYYKALEKSGKFTVSVEDGVLGSLTVTSVAGTASGDTKVTVTETADTGNSFVYKLGTSAESVKYDDDASSWTALTTADITADTNTTISVAEVTAQKKVVGFGSATVVEKS